MMDASAFLSGSKHVAGKTEYPKLIWCMAEVDRADLRQQMGSASDISLSADGKGVLEEVNRCVVDSQTLQIHHSMFGLAATEWSNHPNGLDSASIPKSENMCRRSQSLDHALLQTLLLQPLHLLPLRPS